MTFITWTINIFLGKWAITGHFFFISFYCLSTVPTYIPESKLQVYVLEATPVPISQVAEWVCLQDIGQHRPLFVVFVAPIVLISTALNKKSRDVELGVRTQGSSMVSTDGSTELWWHPPLPPLHHFHFPELESHETKLERFQNLL